MIELFRMKCGKNKSLALSSDGTWATVYALPDGTERSRPFENATVREKAMGEAIRQLRGLVDVDDNPAKPVMVEESPEVPAVEAIEQVPADVIPPSEFGWCLSGEIESDGQESQS